MIEIPVPELTPGQVGVLEKLLRAGYRFVNLEHVARHLVVEKHGFVAMLDRSGGKLTLWGQVGYRMGGGVGMLVEQQGKKVFVRHEEAVAATPELLAIYNGLKEELTRLLEEFSLPTG